MYSSMTNMSVTASHLRIMLIGALFISFLVRTITLKILARVPNRQICGTNNKVPGLCPQHLFQIKHVVAHHQRNITVDRLVLQ